MSSLRSASEADPGLGSSAFHSAEAPDRLKRPVGWGLNHKASQGRGPPKPCPSDQRFRNREPRTGAGRAWISNGRVENDSKSQLRARRSEPRRKEDGIGPDRFSE